VAAALCLLYLALTTRSDRIRRQIIALGLLGYLFYAYGIYVIERAYNGLYLVYMAIFALAFWAMALAGAHLRRDLGAPSLPNPLRIISASGAILQPLISALDWDAPSAHAHRRADRLPLLDLHPGPLLHHARVSHPFRPHLSITRDRNASPAVRLCSGLHPHLFLAVGELVKPLFGATLSPAAFWPVLALSMLFLVLGTLHSNKLRLRERQEDARANQGLTLPGKVPDQVL
jgi:hypothetical protein